MPAETKPAVVKPTPEEQMKAAALAAKSMAESFKIGCPEDREKASGLISTWKSEIKSGKEFFKPMKKAADDAKDAILMREKLVVVPREEAVVALTTECIRWDTEVERKAKEEQKRLEEQAKKEAAERAEREKKAAEEAAARAEAEGDFDAAAEAMNQAKTAEVVSTLPVPTFHVAPPPRPVGESKRDNWGATVTDMAAFLKHIAAHPEHFHLVEPCQPNLNAMARMQKTAMNIPGVTVKNTPSLQHRS